jgi:hypothetical protein
MASLRAELSVQDFSHTDRQTQFGPVVARCGRLLWWGWKVPALDAGRRGDGEALPCPVNQLAPRPLTRTPNLLLAIRPCCSQWESVFEAPLERQNCGHAA